jgi:hypothetical protein
VGAKCAITCANAQDLQSTQWLGRRRPKAYRQVFRRNGFAAGFDEVAMPVLTGKFSESSSQAA